jgi:hypothetical protein
MSMPHTHIAAAAISTVIFSMASSSVATAVSDASPATHRAAVHATSKHHPRHTRKHRARSTHKRRHHHSKRPTLSTLASRAARAARHHKALAPESTTPTPTPTPVAPSPAPTGPVAFSSTSPWNVAIPPSPALDPSSASIAGYLGSEMKAYADLYEYGTPVWEASSSDPYNSVKCTEPWGTCALTQQMIPIPAAAGTSGGSDGSMVVIDKTTNTGYDFWRASRTSTTSWTSSWGTRFNMEGSGTEGGATGAGVPLLAGLPRLSEMAQGHIGHALAFISDNTCASVYRYPASKTDGKSGQSNCIPEGTRIQLDPSINIDALPGITPGEKTVAHALQTYGAYCKDSGGSKLAFGFEDPIGKTNPYPSVGFSWDYYDMPHIPWNQLRVLHQWNGS